MPSLTTAVLTDRALVRVAGAEARPFLNNLLTQEVETLKPGELRYGALLTPQGRLLHELFLLGESDAVLLDCVAAERAALVQRLALYRLRARVAIELAEERVSVVWGEAEGGAALGSEWAPDPRRPELGWRRYGEASGAAAGAAEAYDAHRLECGVADPARDLRDDRTYPIEANFDLLNGIDFRKGCFIGQETTSRMKRRGTTKTRLCPLAFDGPAPAYGTEVLTGDLRAGEVRSGTEGRALAMLRLDRAVHGGLTAEARALRLAPPAWLDPAMKSVEPSEIPPVVDVN